MIDFLYVLDGPAQHVTKKIRRDGSTMADIQDAHENWVLYDRARGHIDTIHLHETPLFVATEESVMKSATEVRRDRYDGVL